MKIEHDDFPSLFRAADNASIKAQKSYLWSVSIDLLLIVIAGIAGAISIESYNYKFALAVTSGIFMAGGLMLTLYIRGRQFEQIWFDGRAVAESVKTSAWRFMVCSEPYHKSFTEAEVIKLFSSSLKKVIEDRKQFAALLIISPEIEPNITPKMLKVRSLSLEDRKNIYLNDRLNNQRHWYANKSKANLKSSNRWFDGIIISQAGALISSFLFIKYPEFPILLPSIFATIAASFMAWLQLKRHQELSNSYGLAAHELGFIAEEILSVKTEEEFSTFVGDAENAISREHTMWVARRDQV